MGEEQKISSDSFEDARSEVAVAAEQIIKNYLMPLQTKKLSKKMIEQIAEECSKQIAQSALAASRKASARQAAKLTSDFTQILKDQQMRTSPVFNDKLSNVTGQLTPEDIEKIQTDRETAARVVSQVYNSFFNFAAGKSTRTVNTSSSTNDKNPKKE